ncbi:hypothetical protein [Treponema sp.]|uniref:hypothetical protein n=1 Tax=Treponema sp. TaxID=166 RepID=UPI00388F3B70
MNRAKTIYATIYLICLMAFTGCASKLLVKPLENNCAQISLELELGKILENTLDTAMSGLNEIEGTRTQNEIFDLPSIKKSIENAGYKNVEISSPERTRLNLSFAGKFDFIESDTDKTTLIVTPEAMQKFSNSLGEEFKSIMDLFMAPVLSDENMSNEEYAELVAVVYGQPLAEEMLKSKMEFSIASPKGKTKAYKIPLVDLLTLSEEKIFTSE